VLGFSIGGCIAQAVAMRHPGRVAGLVLESTRAASRSAGQAAAAVAIPSADAHVERAFSPTFREREAEFMDRYRKMARQNHDRGVMPALAAAAREAPTPDELAELTVQTTVVHARDDEAIPFGHGERLAAAIPGAVLVPFEHSGHSLHIERPAEFNHLLLQAVRG
jgi:3-oxoadipate enol-lactonase